MKTFYTGDTHFNHTNIIKYCARPHNNTVEHDDHLTHNWNSVVAERDIVYHLGDLAFLKSPKDFINIIKYLNGRIMFIWGNHDRQLMKYATDIQEVLGNKITFLGHYHRMKHEGELIILSHYAFRVWDRSHHGSWHLYGHSHGTLPDDPHARSIDVGVDCHNYYPIEFNQIKDIMAKKLWQPIDHHGTHQEAGGIGLSKEDYAKEQRKTLYKQLKKEFELPHNSQRQNIAGHKAAIKENKKIIFQNGNAHIVMK